VTTYTPIKSNSLSLSLSLLDWFLFSSWLANSYIENANNDQPMRQHTHPSSQIPSLSLSRSILLRNGSGSALFICRHYRKQRRSDSVSWEDIWHCERSQHRRDRFMELYQQQLRRLEPYWIRLFYPPNLFQAQQFLKLLPSTQYICVSTDFPSLFSDPFKKIID
jgi:hypothetical protein